MKYLFLLFAFLFTSSSFAQTDKKAALEQQKKDNLSKIKELNSIISRTSKKKKASLGKLSVLKEQIGVQKKQITVLEQNQQILAEEAQKLRNEGDVLKAKLERLKKEYALMIYEAQKTSSVYNKMSFLLLSNDLGEFVRRFDYLRHYSTNRKKQADLIFKTRQDLMTKEQKVVFKKQEEKKVIVEKEGEKKKLEVLKTKEDQVVTVLTQQEKKLKIELEKKKLSVRKLDNLIAGIVQREIQKSIERERKLRQARQVKKMDVVKPALPELKKGETTKILAERETEKKESPKEEKKAAVAEAKKPKAEPAPAPVVEEKKIESNT